MSNLVGRVRGLGDEAGERLKGVVAFGSGGAPLRPAVTGSLDDDLAALLSLDVGAPGRDRLAAALEEVVLTWPPIRIQPRAWT